MSSPGDLLSLRQALRQFLPTAFSEWERTTADVGEAESGAARIAAARVWQRTLFDAGWAGIAIPKQYGGRGDGIAAQIAFNEEAARAGVPRSGLFVSQFLAAPTLIEWGSAQQKDRHVRQTLMGDQVWCQLFSEPDAGSDLASLRTGAARDGNRWIVNGQKVWSSSAHLADFGLLLARTDTSAPKHKGITAFILDMRSPGVVVRPLRKMGGGFGFNEVFFDNVEIPDANRIGEPGAGWKIAMAALGHERLGLTGQFKADLSGLVSLARRCFPEPATRPEFIRTGIAALYARSLAINALGQATAAILLQGGVPGPRGSVGKLMLGALMNDTADFALRIEAFPDGALCDDSHPSKGKWQAELLEHPARRISGGSDQIQRGLIAERILGFPKARAAAGKGTPMNSEKLVLDAPLNPDLTVFRDSVRKYLGSVSWRSKARQALDAGTSCWTPELWSQACRSTGIAAITISTELGGAGSSLTEAGLVAGELGYALAGSPWFASVALAATALNECADTDSARTLLAGIASGETTATLAGIEQFARSRSSLPVAAVHGSAVVVDGLCRGVLDAQSASALIVICRDTEPEAARDRLRLVLLLPGADGITVSPRRTLDGSRPLGDVAFSQARGLLLGSLTQAQGERVWQMASLLLAQELLGCAQYCLEMTADYLKVRRQFGQLIAEFQAVQHRCADIYMKLDAARATTAYAMEAMLCGAADRRQAAAAAKLLANEAARFTVEETIQLHGGIGYTWDHDAHLYFRRVKSCALMLGDDDFLHGETAAALEL